MKKSATSQTHPARKLFQNRNFLLYIAFVGITVVWWYVLHLSKSYQTTLDIPVVYGHPPMGWLLEEDNAKNYLHVEVQASGWDLFHAKYGFRKKPVVIALDRYVSTSPAEGRFRYSMAGNRLMGDLHQWLGSRFAVLRVTPDTLIFHFTSVKTIKVAITPVLRVAFKEQFMAVGSPLLQPDSIYVSGPSNVLDTLRTIYTVPLTERNADDILQVDLSLLPISSRIEYSSEKTHLTLPISRYTEAVYEVPVQIIHQADSVTRVHLSPAAIQIRCKVGTAFFPQIEASDFLATIDFRELINYQHTGLKATVSVTRLPEGVVDIQLHPAVVDYLLEHL